MSKKLKKLIFKAKNKLENLAAKSKKEPKLVHAYVRSKLILKDTVRALRDERVDLIMGKGKIADLLNKHFHSIYTIMDKEDSIYKGDGKGRWTR